MANSMDMREAEKRKLIELINQELAKDNPHLTMIVQDAARLAKLSNNHYYYMLFSAHVGGSPPQGDYLAPIYQDEALQKKVLKDFQSDRTWTATIYNNQLQEVE